MAVSAGSADIDVTAAGVATSLFNDAFGDMTDWLVTTSGGVSVPTRGKMWKWDELNSWGRALDMLQALGYSIGSSSPWDTLGINKEGGPTVGMLEERRRMAKALMSAGSAFNWTQEEVGKSTTAMTEIEHALTLCHEELPDLNRKLKRKKAGKALVPMWQEPSVFFFEFALQSDASLTIALHLSNLQQVQMQSYVGTRVAPNGNPRVLSVTDTRDLYTRLAQSQTKIEEALRKFATGGLVMWVPGEGEQLPRIMNSIQRLYTEESITVHIQFLIPFIPFPELSSPAAILDLWGHALLNPKYSSMIQHIRFIREASRCVFTRDDSPVYAVKHILSIGVQANTGGAQAVVQSLNSSVLSIPLKGDLIYVDVPQEHVMVVKHALYQFSAAEADLPQEWRNELRSRGFTKTHPRQTIIGLTPKSTDFEVSAIVNKMIKLFQSSGFGDFGILVGRQSLFNNVDAVLVEASMPQIQKLACALGECILVSPHKAVCVPERSAEEITGALTVDESLHTVTLRYRKSGPLRGAVFARPKALQEHVWAEKKRAFAKRQPQPQASLLQRQAQIEVLGLDSNNYNTFPQKLMSKISDLFQTTLVESEDQESELATGAWRAIKRGEHWNGKILLQCTEDIDMTKLFRAINGRGVCIDGYTRTLEVTSPTNSSLSAHIFNASLSTNSS